jgi:hypothetical protein
MSTGGAQSPELFPELIQLFDSLQAPTNDVGMGRFCALSVQGFPCCAVGKDVAGNPVLLINAEANSASTVSPLVLEHLSVIHLVPCRVHDANLGERQQVLTVVRCNASDRTMQEFFLRSLYPIVAALPEHPTRQQIGIAVDRLVNLFRQLTQSPRKAIAGLWAELFIISRSGDPQSLLSAWHAIPEERYDFFSGADRVEVKSTTGPMRVHHFSLEQLRPPTGTRVLVASLHTNGASGGSSINDLVDVIRRSVTDPDSLIQLDASVAQTLGQDWRAMRDHRFDYQAALASLRFFDAASIPSVALPLPSELSSVSFRVDLSQLQVQPLTDLVDSSDLFHAAVTSAITQ